jgi:hypothetical protein
MDILFLSRNEEKKMRNNLYMLAKVYMDFNKVAKKAAAVVVGLGLIVTQAAPALALTQATDGIYERVPMMGVRLSLVDFGTGSGGSAFSTTGSSADLTRSYIDMNFNDDMNVVDFGEMLVYGNDDADEYGENSYEAFAVEFGDAYNAASDVPDFAIVAKDSSNSNNIVYRTFAFDASAGTGYVYTVDDKPNLNTNSLSDFFDDAVASGTAQAEVASTNVVTTFDFDGNLEVMFSSADTATANKSVVFDWFEAIAGGASNQSAGDPDILTDEFDEIYFWTTTPSGEEVAYKVDMNLSSAAQDAETPEVDEESVKAVMRGTRARIEWAPVMEEGVVGYEVELSGAQVDGGNGSGGVLTNNNFGEESADLNGVAAANEGGVNWFTKAPQLFAIVEADETYDLNIYTVNAEGDKSEGFDTDIEVDSDRVDFSGDMPLSDVEEGSTFYNYIQYLYKLSIVDGYSDGEYKADETVTRGQLAKFAVNAFQIPIMTGGESFEDVETTDTFYTQIQTLKNAGIVNGYSDGTFKADNEVTRAEATSYIVRSANFYSADNVSESSGCFDDVDGNVHEGNICALADYNDKNIQPIIGGYSDGNFGADDPLTRGQMAKIILNAAGSINVNEDADAANAEVSFINFNNRFSDDAEGELYTGSYDINNLSNENYFVRPFVAPAEVKDFDAEATSSVVTLTWTALSTHDDSVSGYIVERRERDGSEADDETGWEQIDPTGVTNSVITSGATATLADNDSINDDTRYEYRIAAFKYIPAFASDEEYANQAAVEADTDEARLNMIVGPWVFTSIKTDESA